MVQIKSEHDSYRNHICDLNCKKQVCSFPLCNDLVDWLEVCFTERRRRRWRGRQRLVGWAVPHFHYGVDFRERLSCIKKKQQKVHNILSDKKV